MPGRHLTVYCTGSVALGIVGQAFYRAIRKRGMPAIVDMKIADSSVRLSIAVRRYQPPGYAQQRYIRAGFSLMRLAGLRARNCKTMLRPFEGITNGALSLSAYGELLCVRDRTMTLSPAWKADFTHILHWKPPTDGHVAIRNALEHKYFTPAAGGLRLERLEKRSSI